MSTISSTKSKSRLIFDFFFLKFGDNFGRGDDDFFLVSFCALPALMGAVGFVALNFAVGGFSLTASSDKNWRMGAPQASHFNSPLPTSDLCPQ